MANFAWIISMLAMTIAFPTFFIFSATRRRGLLTIALTSVVIAVIAALIAGLAL
ncbi:hypothetical protein ACUN9V_04570 [Salinicola sp. V024]|uniref:hypothetical protein n=1 Tax=Salinicola TaxID=404432 RepID=UPI000AA354F2|nr:MULTISPECIES: hypothetical protein [Salinicola]